MITTCEKLKLDIFVDCLVTGEYSSLAETKAEKKDTNAQRQAWEKIRTQYAELTEDSSYKAMTQLYAQMVTHEAKLAIISACVDVLTFQYSEEIVKLLEQQDASLIYVWDWKDKKAYERNIKSIISRSKTFVVELEKYRRDWDAIVAKSAESGEMNRNYFEDTLIVLSEENGYNLNMDTITVHKFARLLVANKRKAQKTPPKR